MFHSFNIVIHNILFEKISRKFKYPTYSKIFHAMLRKYRFPLVFVSMLCNAIETMHRVTSTGAQGISRKYNARLTRSRWITRPAVLAINASLFKWNDAIRRFPSAAEGRKASNPFRSSQLTQPTTLRISRALIEFVLLRAFERLDKHTITSEHHLILYFSL